MNERPAGFKLTATKDGEETIHYVSFYRLHDYVKGLLAQGYTVIDEPLKEIPQDVVLNAE